MIKFLKYLVLIESILFVLIYLVLGEKEVWIISIVMFFPSMWWARLKLAKAYGIITERFKFMASLGIPTVFTIWNANTLDRKIEPQLFRTYVARESIYCTFVWIFLLANLVLPKFIKQLGF